MVAFGADDFMDDVEEDEEDNVPATYDALADAMGEDGGMSDAEAGGSGALHYS